MRKHYKDAAINFQQCRFLGCLDESILTVGRKISSTVKLLFGGVKCHEEGGKNESTKEPQRPLYIVFMVQCKLLWFVDWLCFLAFTERDVQ